MSTEKQIWTSLVTHSNFTVGDLIKIVDDEFHYLSNVLRVKLGSELELTNANGIKAQAFIQSIEKKHLFCHIEKIVHFKRSEPSVQLWLAMPKPSLLEEIIASASEMGVDSIHIFRSEKASTKSLPKIEKLQRISIEALRISKSAFCADIHCYEDFSAFNAVHLPTPLSRLVLFCDESHIYTGQSSNTIARVLSREDLYQYKEVCILIGPEASFSKGERDFIHTQIKPISVSLGSNILRVPTAVCVALGTTLQFK